MKTKISKSDFDFIASNFGAYIVTYTSPLTKKCFCNRITDMELIDLTKNSLEPKQTHLEQLKRIIKQGL
jgi:hypothetical protein